MTTTYTPTRPIMTRDELAAHHVKDYGRDYSESCDGYGDMEAEQGRGWRVIGAWGRDGWDLGDWPYVAFYVKPAANRFDPDTATTFGLLQIIEGDRTLWEFTSREDRSAALDYLFLWYSAGEDWAPVTREQRAELDAGTLAVDDRFRGPYRA